MFNTFWSLCHGTYTRTWNALIRAVYSAMLNFLLSIYPHLQNDYTLSER